MDTDESLLATVEQDEIDVLDPKPKPESWVWDVGTPEPEKIKGILAEKSMTPVHIKITSQPFFGKRSSKIIPDDFGYMDKSEIEPDKLNYGTLGRVNMNPIQQQFMNRRYRAMVDDAMTNAITTGTGFIKINSINPKEVLKPMKCDKCTSNANRLTLPPAMEFQPEKCKICGSNPLLKDNFEAMPIPWPPEENQNVWCISARGDIYETTYDNERNWTNLVNVYPTEKSAETSRKVLLNARKLPNDD